MRTVVWLVLGVLGSGTVGPVAAQTALSWARADAALTRQVVELEQTGGRIVGGRVLGIAGDSLRLLVTKPKSAAGELSVPRDEIVRLRVQRRPVKGRVVGTVLGGLLGGIGAVIGDGGNGAVRVTVPLLYGGVGYWLGGKADKARWEEVRLVR